MKLPADPAATKFALMLFADLAKRHDLVPADDETLLNGPRGSVGWTFQRGEHIAHVWVNTGGEGFVDFHQMHVDHHGTYIMRMIPATSSGPFLIWHPNYTDERIRGNLTALRNFFTRPLRQLP